MVRHLLRQRRLDRLGRHGILGGQVPEGGSPPAHLVGTAHALAFLRVDAAHLARDIDLCRQHAELLDDEDGLEVAKQAVVALRLVVAALDEDGAQVARRDLGPGLLPDLQVARAQGDGVGLDVAEDEDLAVVGLVLDEVGARVVDAVSFLLEGGRAEGDLAEEAGCPWGRAGMAEEFATGGLHRGGVVATEAS